MIVLDTNVVSELVRGPQANRDVLAWVRQLRQQPVTTVFNRAELLAGVALLPSGERRERLAGTLTAVLADLQVCLPFPGDGPAAYAEIVAVRRRQGRPIATMDALIASVAVVHSASVATRDVEGFNGLGLEVVDPWSAA